VLSLAAFTGGGIGEFLEMEIEEFILWLNSARELQKT